MNDYKQHPEYKALLRSVVETPHDMAPRLILSDWIEEHDDPKRAEEIRLAIRAYDAGDEKFKQAEPIQLLSTTSLDAHRQLIIRSRYELDAANDYPNYLKSFPIYGISTGSRRGFIEHVECTFDELAENHAIFNYHPIVSVVLIGDNPLTDLGYLPQTLNGFQMLAYVGNKSPFLFANSNLRQTPSACIDWCRNKCGLPPLAG